MAEIDGQLVLTDAVVDAENPTDSGEKARFDCSYRARSIQADGIRVHAPGGWWFQEAEIQGSVEARRRSSGALSADKSLHQGGPRLQTHGSATDADSEHGPAQRARRSAATSTSAARRSRGT